MLGRVKRWLLAMLALPLTLTSPHVVYCRETAKSEAQACAWLRCRPRGRF